jgi:hypothetical protein
MRLATPLASDDAVPRLAGRAAITSYKNIKKTRNR